MVYSITPTYYAAEERVTQYVLQGRGFLDLPDNAVGVMSTNNDNPLMLRDNHGVNNNYRIVSKTREELVMEQIQMGTHDTPNYLGGILSEDRTTVYWVNETKPLP